MRNSTSFLSRILQFAVLAVLGAVILFARASAEPAADTEQRFLTALETGDRAVLIALLAGDVRTTASTPQGGSVTLVGPASALGFLDSWRAQAGTRVRLRVAERGAAGSQVTLTLAPAAASRTARLRVALDQGHVTSINSF